MHDALQQIDLQVPASRQSSCAVPSMTALPTLQAPGAEDEEAMTRQIRPLENRLDKVCGCRCLCLVCVALRTATEPHGCDRRQ